MGYPKLDPPQKPHFWRVYHMALIWFDSNLFSLFFQRFSIFCKISEKLKKWMRRAICYRLVQVSCFWVSSCADSSGFTSIHHHPSSIIFIHHHHHPSSPIIVHHHRPSSPVIYRHPSSPIITHATASGGEIVQRIWGAKSCTTDLVPCNPLTGLKIIEDPSM